LIASQLLGVSQVEVRHTHIQHCRQQTGDRGQKKEKQRERKKKRRRNMKGKLDYGKRNGKKKTKKRKKRRRTFLCFVDDRDGLARGVGDVCVEAEGRLLQVGNLPGLLHELLSDRDEKLRERK
jgi:hypothetical protein